MDASFQKEIGKIKMVYVLLAQGFEEIEAITPIDLLRRAEVEVITVGVTGKMVTGSHGITVEADITLDEVNPNGLELLVLPGGNPGFKNLEQNKVVQDLIDYCVNSNIYIGAICAAPSILGRMGILEGKKATVYPGMEDQLKGADVKNNEVVIDDKIITSRGAGTSIPFAAALISVLVGQEKADEILKSIVYKQN